MKKKEWTRKITLYVAILFFTIVFLESVIYYRDIITNKFYLIVQAISDAILVFGIDASLDIFDILEVQAVNESFALGLLNHAYILCYFGAPLITAKCITKFIGYIVKEKLIDFNFSRSKERILIVGYNDYVEKLLKNTIHQKEDKKECKLLVLHRDDISEKTKFRFQMSGVSFLKYEKLDYEDENDRKMILKWVKPEKIKRIILFEDKAMDNVSNYCFLLKCFEKESCSGFKDGLEIDCSYDLAQVEELIWACFDKKKEKLKIKYSMNTFSVPMLRAQSVLEKTKIYDNVLKENGECEDIHLLIIGFGKMGRRFLKRAINECVVSEKNNILIDIIEKDTKKIKEYLGNIHKNYYGDEENTIHVDCNVTEGDLKIRFHIANVNEKQFTECMEVASYDKPFTYIAICVDDPEAGISCMLSVEDYLARKEQKVPVLVRMDSGQQLKGLEEIYENLKLVPGDDEILSMENIHSKELEMVSSNIHKKDNKEQQSKAQLAYQIESRKYRVLHYKAKSAVYEKLDADDKKYMKKIFTSDEYTADGVHKEFINKINVNKLLFKFGAIEHRRWSYYVISKGWSYGSERDDKNKITQCLCPFSEILSSDNPEIKKTAHYEYKDWYELITK